MNENFEHTQPNQIENTQPTQIGAAQPPEPRKDDTQPIKPVKKRSRWLSFFTGLLGFLLLLGLGSYGGYATALTDRQNAEKSQVSAQLMDQYQLALAEIQLGRYENARQRLEFIIAKDPSFPGVAEKLTEVMVISSIPTATATATLAPTPDFSGAENAFQRARQLIAAQDWVNALSAIDIVRKLDPSYKTTQVDGMYYFALRNQGNNLIAKGNLEGGIYYLTLAERFGPLDNTSIQLRENARIYLIGASFWELDWRQAIEYFSQINGANISDGEMNATQRLNFAYMRYGDQFFEQEEFCNAYEQYSNASALDAKSTERSNYANAQCNPPAVVDPAAAPTP
jgi:tetratricopeptide (TPR) repeat protein